MIELAIAMFTDRSLPLHLRVPQKKVVAHLVTFSLYHTCTHTHTYMYMYVYIYIYIHRFSPIPAVFLPALGSPECNQVTRKRNWWPRQKKGIAHEDGMGERNIWGFSYMGLPQNGWSWWKMLLEWMISGYLYSRKPSYSWVTWSCFIFPDENSYHLEIIPICSDKPFIQPMM